MKEAEIYIKKDNKILCQACEHRCLILENKRGLCGVRENIKGKLNLLVYGEIAAYNIDPIEKKPLFHFLPSSKILSIGTVGCNFKCLFCQNSDLSQSPKPNKPIVGQDTSITEIINDALNNNCNAIAYTYNEPAIFVEFVKDIAQEAKKNNLKNIYVTSGFETPEALDYMDGLIDAMNIDLKSFSDKFYQDICSARLKPVLETIKLAKQKKIWIEITTLIIPNKNDSEKEFKQIAEFIASIDKNIPWHIIRFFPAYQMKDVPITPIEKLQKAYKIGKQAGLNYVYLGNVSNSKVSTYCPKCKTLCIDRQKLPIINKLKKGKCPNCKEEIKGIW